MGIKEVLSAPRSPWQRAYVERVIGTIRRECLDHVIVFSEASLRRTLLWYFTYHHGARTHLSLSKDAPDTRPVHPTTLGRVMAIPQGAGCITESRVTHQIADASVQVRSCSVSTPNRKTASDGARLR